MNATTKISCPCNNCDAHIDFDAQQAGTTIPCPQCGLDTVLFVPANKERLFKEQQLKEQLSNHYQRKVVAAAIPTAMQPLLQTCPACQGKVSSQATACPHCGQPLKAAPSVASATSFGDVFSIVLKVILALFVIGVILAILSFCVNN
jgi:predicted RNA-binding Zn-ribbon protein involved in translation (DUF1610 family)